MCDNPELEGTGQTGNGRGANDRPDDPLFPLMPRVLEALRARAMENRTESTGTLDEYAALIETICGATDDSQPVEQYNGALGVTQAFVAANQRPVGQIQWNDNLATIYTNPGNVNGARWCSGTLISNDLFLTAGHCFDQTGGGWNRPRVNGTTNIIPPAEIARNMRVNFNFQVDPMGNPRPVSFFAITQLVEYRLGGLDFAIVRLAGNPGATWGRTPISTTDAVAGEMLCIMGHPLGVPKRIEAGPALAPAGNQIRYDDIDTQGGNSGSGVLRASDGRIVGVHTNGGCTPAGPGNGSNFGMRIASCIAASPTLQALTRPTLKFRDDLVTSATEDRPPVTLKRLDDGGTTLKAIDDGGVPTTIKFIDDGGSMKAIDDVATTAARDVTATRKALDDVKSPALDKGLSDQKLPASDLRAQPGRFRPGPLQAPPGVARPFALQQPHHSMAWQNEAQQGADAEAEMYEATLAQLGETIAQQQALLEQLDEQYRAVLAEYEQIQGGASDGGA
jgi:V8-like Glu-specific endopeptidase